ncbi:MAG: MerR family transcriptional regulator [Flavobacteriales bacterium]|nr:MerR family transcriptional regulator [Flavobacteriales bacterium]
MAHYSIKDLEKLSGVKAHTIRIWEKRYGVIKPTRTDTNIRVYCDTELKKLLNVAILNSHGHKISKIAKFKQDEIFTELEKLNSVEQQFQVQIDLLVMAMIDLDRRQFEKVLADSTLKIGFEDTAIKILYPFLQKVGVMWQTDDVNPAQEHFISSLIIQKLYVAIDQAYQPEIVNAKKALLYLPEGEYHEMGLLFYRYLMKRRGYETIYLGQSVPYSDLVKVINSHNPDVVVTAFVASIQCEKLQSYLKTLASDLKNKLIIATGYQVCNFNLPLPKKVKAAQDVHEFISFIQKDLPK